MPKERPQDSAWQVRPATSYRPFLLEEQGAYVAGKGVKLGVGGSYFNLSVSHHSGRSKEPASAQPERGRMACGGRGAGSAVPCEGRDSASSRARGRTERQDPRLPGGLFCDMARSLSAGGRAEGADLRIVFAHTAFFICVLF